MKLLVWAGSGRTSVLGEPGVSRASKRTGMCGLSRAEFFWPMHICIFYLFLSTPLSSPPSLLVPAKDLVGWC